MLVNVSPDMGMYHLLRSQGYDPAYALAEFVDNALQAHLSVATVGAAPINVDLWFHTSDHPDAGKRNTIVIEDDGPGIPGARLADAMKPARPAPEKGLSEFGIGMKAAAVWFGDIWVLETTPSGSATAFEITFNLPGLMSSGKSTVPVKTPAAAPHSGTTLTLKQLRRSIDAAKYQHICDVLRELYQRFSAGSSPVLKLTAHYNETPIDLQYPAVDRAILEVPEYRSVNKVLYAIGQPKTWTVPVDITFEGYSVQGFVCLLERGSYTTNPGLVMFRNDRVIKGTLKNPNIPVSFYKTSNKYARQRVYGELFVDPHMPVTYTKDGFEIDEAALMKELAKIEGMAELLRQADEYRPTSTNVVNVASEADIPGKAGKAQPAKKSAPGGLTSSPTKPAPTPATAPQPSSTPPASPTSVAPPPRTTQLPAFITLLDTVRPHITSAALCTLMDEARSQFNLRRPISAAMCIRTVVELAIMEKIRTSFTVEYPKVSEKGIAALLRYLASNSRTFFDAKADYHIDKCVQGLGAGAQDDVVILNNTAHGHYRPSLDQLNRFAGNVEALLRWACC